eukprot:maker-scaffold_151-snap-gene-0.6-mRNA-1 protein AED:0.43 eAED:0.45 QI:0/0/0/1/0/0/7/0/226
MNAWLPQASYPCGSIGHAFTVHIHTENLNQEDFCPFTLHEISVLIGSSLGHLCYHLTDVPPQPNSPSANVFQKARRCFDQETVETWYFTGNESPTYSTPHIQAQQVDRDSRNLVNPFMRLDDEAFGYLKRVIVTPAVYPRLIEFLHFDIQSTWQKSHCVIILCLGRLLYLYHPAKRPNLSAATVRKQQTGRCNTFKQRPSHKTSRANPFPEVSDLMCRLPLSTLFY